MSKQHTIAIVGIDTDVGKSCVTGLLARYLIQQGKQASTLKLVQTGCSAQAEDILLHRRLMGTGLTKEDANGISCPYIFPFPASPLLSARMEGRQIKTAVLNASLSAMQQAYSWLLVEGAGGMMVPLNEDMVLLDYLHHQELPVVLVTTARLGSINHTRLSLEALRNRGMRLLGLVYNLYGDHPAEIVRDTLVECRRALNFYGFAERLLILPDMRESAAVAWQILVEAAEEEDKK